MKIANIDGENLHIFWTTWGISMNFLGKMWLFRKNKQGPIFSLEDTFLEKPDGRVKMTHPQPIKGRNTNLNLITLVPSLANC